MQFVATRRKVCHPWSEMVLLCLRQGISLPDPKPHEKFYRADTPQQRYEKMCGKLV